MGLLDNRVCVITGGAGSVGLATGRCPIAKEASVIRWAQRAGGNVA